MSFCRDCLADAPDRAARCPACGSPRLVRHPEARHAYHRARRLRRLLRHHREARRSVARRQTGDRRRRQARRGGRRCYVARTYGIRSAMPMFEAKRRCPACRRDQAEHGEIRRGRPRSAQRDARPDAAGRAAVDRRSLSRSHRHRTAARHERGQGAGAFCRQGRARARHHGFDRPVRQQIPGQDRLRSGQAARLCGAWTGRGRRVSGAEAGRFHLRRRRGQRGQACRRRLPH